MKTIREPIETDFDKFWIASAHKMPMTLTCLVNMRKLTLRRYQSLETLRGMDGDENGLRARYLAARSAWEAGYAAGFRDAVKEAPRGKHLRAKRGRKD